MSQPTPTASSTSSENLKSIFEASLKEYEKKTENSLLTHPLMAQFKACDSPAEILVVLRSQVAQFEETTAADEKLIKWLDPIVNVLSASSSVISAGVGLVFSPADVIFAGAGVLLSAAQGVIASHDALIIVFGQIESFFRRLEEHAEVPMTDAMKDIMVKILVEVLDIFAIMTKEIKQGRAKSYVKKFFKKLIGKKGIEDALSKLDRLTREEVDLAIVQIQTVAHDIQKGVNQLLEDEREMKARAEEEMQRKIIEERRSRVRADQAWLSPPDPSTDQNTASKAQHQGTATWFFEGDISMEWKSKSTAPFLWIHGKPGSGKSVLCSAIIQDIMALQEAGQATIAYFYFGFKDTDKQDLRNALASLLTQLSAHSDSYCDILCDVYKEHNYGKSKPSHKKMITCLKKMLALPGQGPVYIILDALDECPNTSELPSAREEVLNFLKDLVDAQLSDLHICVTSRPEIDIRAVLKPLPFRPLSIHDQQGQKTDIENYIKHVVDAKSNTAMGRWRNQDKQLVIDTLRDKADGMFRWVFCQLRALRHCLPTAIRQTLSELPKTLDETYERVLNEIREADRGLAHRLLQCLTMAIRPLRVEELAEILVLDFEVAKGETPKLNEDYRSENPQEDVLSICSSLIMEVETGHSRVIQFSHFSVKEFLTSGRLAAFQGEISRVYIGEELAHTTLAQACLGTLLRLDGSSSNLQVNSDFPFARYASQHLVEHAQFGEVSSKIKDGMRRLFNSTEPYFATWLRLYDMDDHWNQFGNSWAARGSPLYYASLCGFYDLAEHIINAHPEQVNAKGGRNHSPLAAALYKKHFHVAELLHQHGAAINATGHSDQTPLQAASVDGSSDVARWLLDRCADTHSQRDDLGAPIHLATANGHLEVIRTLLEYKVYVDSVDKDGRTPLHLASSSGKAEIVRLLLEQGANANTVDKVGWTLLHLATTPEVVRLLLDHGASPDEEV